MPPHWPARGQSTGTASGCHDRQVLTRGNAMLAVAPHLRGQELSLREIAARLVIANGKKKGQHPALRPVTSPPPGGWPTC